ncbi:MAG TPA: collagen-like protein [Thermomicrobiales bacterium]|nr:collagen-like protein [Thermomicrobiales bacterium]
MNRAARNSGNQKRRMRSTPSILIAGAALFIALGGSAVAAGLIRSEDIAPGAITSKAIRDGAVKPDDLSTTSRDLLQGAPGETGKTGSPGAAGSNGANGPNGANGVDGKNGTNGINGTNGTDGVDGTIAPLSATKGVTALPTAASLTTVVELAVPTGKYVVLAKTQLSHTGAGDTVECQLKSGGTTIDQIAMKTLPALAAIPASMQAVITVASPSQLSVQCKVKVADGAADFNSLIAIPTG